MSTGPFEAQSCDSVGGFHGIPLCVVGASRVAGLSRLARSGCEDRTGTRVPDRGWWGWHTSANACHNVGRITPGITESPDGSRCFKTHVQAGLRVHPVVIWRFEVPGFVVFSSNSMTVLLTIQLRRHLTGNIGSIPSRIHAFGIRRESVVCRFGNENRNAQIPTQRGHLKQR